MAFFEGKAGSRYAVALVAVAAAAALRGALTPTLGLQVPFLTFYPAVMLAGWFGGLGPGLLASGLSGLIAQFFWLEPSGSLAVNRAADGVSLLVFLGSSVLISVLSGQRLAALGTARENAVLAEQRLHALHIQMKERELAEGREAATRRWALDTLASIGDAVICTDVDGVITYLNPIAEELTGWPSTDAVKRPLCDVFVIINEDTRQTVDSPVTRVLREGVIAGLANHTLLVRRNGDHVPIDDSGAPIRDANKRIVGAVLVFRDISERKVIEDDLRRTSAWLARSNEDLAAYAYAISHDLQEPVRAMRSFSQLLERRYQHQFDEPGGQYLAFIQQSGERMSRMIQELLSFSRLLNAEASFGEVRLSDVVNWAEQNLKALLEESGACVRCDALPVVHADHIQLVQLFQNLISNAIKYRGVEAPRIHIRAVELQDRWRVEVQDNGRGVPAGAQEFIFGLFKRGDTDVPGSGIGLAICKRIVMRHGGDIWVESEPGTGSTFLFTLCKPAARAKAS